MKKSLKKQLLFGAPLGVAVLGLMAYAGWWWIGLPLYEPEPTSAKSAYNLIRGAHFVPRSLSDSRIAVAPDVELQIESHGLRNGPLAIIISGGPGAPPGSPWPGLRFLERTHHCVYYHQRGSGLSTRLPLALEGGYIDMQAEVNSAYGMAQQVADVERLRLALEAPTVTIVGHSFGALIATLYAAEFPKQVDHLVLLAPAPLLQFPTEGQDLFQLIEGKLGLPLREEFLSFKERYLDFSPKLFTRTEEQLQELNQELHHFYAQAVADLGWAPPSMADGAPPIGGWMVFGIYLSLGMHHDYRAAVRQATPKGRAVLVHFLDDLQPEAATRSYLESLPKAQMLTVAGGHFAHLAKDSAGGLDQALSKALH